jgi:hypothetical protein
MALLPRTAGPEVAKNWMRQIEFLSLSPSGFAARRAVGLGLTVVTHTLLPRLGRRPALNIVHRCHLDLIQGFPAT